ncbi:MAG: hypothetical protein ACREPK_06280 [Rhodanobacteraceae bacterium]
MNKLIGPALAALCGIAAIATPALAQTVPVPPASQQSNATVAPSTRPAKKPRRALPAPGSPNCLLYTGSHIRPPKGQCLPVTGVSFSQQDIERTGAMNLGDALQMLVPSATIHD